MPELYSPEDEAARYVLGELTVDERRSFETRLAQSADLRAMVRGLEEGAVALSMASPRRQPPHEVWVRIEKAVTGGTRRKPAIPAFWVNWWRNGWAAAAACLVGWLLYAFWANRAGPSGASSVTIDSKVGPQRGAAGAGSDADKTSGITRKDNTEDNAALQALQARTQEIGVLRWQIAELTNRLTHLSQTLAQQQALLSESSRLKFFQLTSHSAGDSGATNAPISPALQRALLLAMARELGWAPSSAPAGLGKTESGLEPRNNSSNPTVTNRAEVDFVDLRPGSNSVPTKTSQPQANPEPSNTAEPSSLASTSSNAVPGFVSGTNAVLAIDSSVVPIGSYLTFSTMTSWGQYYSLGSAVLGNNPMVVTVPFAVSSWSGGNVTVFAGTPNGASNVIGQITLPISPPP